MMDAATKEKYNQWIGARTRVTQITMQTDSVRESLGHIVAQLRNPTNMDVVFPDGNNNHWRAAMIADIELSIAKLDKHKSELELVIERERPK